MDNNYKFEEYMSEVMPMSSGLRCIKPNQPECRDIDSLPSAIAYVPIQKWKRTYDTDVALERGTIFPELDLPFVGEEES